MVGGNAAIAVGQVRVANSRSAAHSRHQGFGAIEIGAAAFKALLTFQVRDPVSAIRTTAVPSCELEISTHTMPSGFSKAARHSWLSSRDSLIQIGRSWPPAAGQLRSLESHHGSAPDCRLQRGSAWLAVRCSASAFAIRLFVIGRFASTPNAIEFARIHRVDLIDLLRRNAKGYWG